MSMFTVNTHRFDPYQGFKFRVKWDNKIVAAVCGISALTRTTEPVVHRDGASPSNFRVSPGSTKFAPIVLERGVTHDTAFADWASLTFNLAGDAAMSLKNYRKDIIIELLNHQGTVVMAYKVYRCWVSEYQALPELDANGTCVALEKIVLQHEGWERDVEVHEPTET